MVAEADPKRIVARGYDEVAERYLEWHAGPDATTAWFLDEVDARTPGGAVVLDLGAGAGVPVTRRLARGRDVIALDISWRQLSLARSLVPDARLVMADVTNLPVRFSAVDAVVAFYCFVHVPKAEQPPTLRAAASCLRPGGVFAANFGTGGSDDSIEGDWLGVPMFFASHSPQQNDDMVRDAGLQIQLSEVRSIEEDGESVEFHWIIATSPAR
jgi:SAM-dependent methyltransferase